SNQGLEDSDLKVGEYGETEDYEATIALIGSSVAEHWLGGVLKAAEDHNYRVLNMTRSATRFSTGYTEQVDKVTWNNHVLDYLKEEDVDLIVGQATASDTSKDVIHQQMIDQLQFVHDEYGIEVLAVRDNPRYSFSVLESMETSDIEDTTIKMNKEKDNQLDESFWRTFEKDNESLYKMDLTKYFKMDDTFQPVIGN